MPNNLPGFMLLLVLEDLKEDPELNNQHASQEDAR